MTSIKYLAWQTRLGKVFSPTEIENIITNGPPKVYENRLESFSPVPSCSCKGTGNLYDRIAESMRDNPLEAAASLAPPGKRIQRAFRMARILDGETTPKYTEMEIALMKAGFQFRKTPGPMVAELKRRLETTAHPFKA